jgi:hypothetical protein
MRIRRPRRARDSSGLDRWARRGSVDGRWGVVPRRRALRRRLSRARGGRRPRARGGIFLQRRSAPWCRTAHTAAGRADLPDSPRPPRLPADRRRSEDPPTSVQRLLIEFARGLPVATAQERSSSVRRGLAPEDAQLLVRGTRAGARQVRARAPAARPTRSSSRRRSVTTAPACRRESKLSRPTCGTAARTWACQPAWRVIVTTAIGSDNPRSRAQLLPERRLVGSSEPKHHRTRWACRGAGFSGLSRDRGRSSGTAGPRRTRATRRA